MKSNSMTFVLLLAVALLWPTSSYSADHRDGPVINEYIALDLLDFFAFQSPSDSSKVVLAGTFNGFTVPGTLGVGFASNGLYEFKIDNNNDFVEDLVIQATFTKIGSDQTVTVRGPAKPKIKGAKSILLSNKEIALTGLADGSTLTSADGKYRIFAGTRDDPFFTDLIWVLRQIGVLAGGPLTRANGIDFLAGLNCSIFAIELPANLLTKGNSNSLNVWATTSLPQNIVTNPGKDPSQKKGSDGRKLFVQIERTAAPVVNTVINSRLTNNVAAKDTFNRTTPKQDAAKFRQTAIDALVAIGILDAATAATVVDTVLIPDVLRFDVSKADGFPNGRRPADDVINTILSAASNGALTSDGVNANDVAFPSTFPFFAAPHSAAEGVPARDA